MPNKKTKIIFLGTGPSSGVPNLQCLIKGGCNVCLSNTNNRTNVSILICKDDILLIDCTKDFKYQYEKYLLNEHSKRQNNITACQKMHNKVMKSNTGIDFNNINADKPVDLDSAPKGLSINNVLLTHPHADAILGLDTLKQTILKGNECTIHANKETCDYLLDNFTYLFAKGVSSVNSSEKMLYNVIEENAKYNIAGFSIKPYSVPHGTCNSYAYFIDKKVLYVSDCSQFTLDVKADILIIECTTKDKYAFGHLNFDDVIIAIDKVKPSVTYLVGMSHLIDHNEFSSSVQTHKYNIVVAYDMMEIEY